MTTKSAKRQDVEHRWFVVDLDGAVLGRAATRIASILRGKHKAIYTPHVDTGDYVVVINADKVMLTGRKESKKLYHRHTGWVGSLVTRTVAEVRARKPEMLISNAVKGMLPRGPLGREMFSKLKVYAGSEHPHQAQSPELLDLC